MLIKVKTLTGKEIEIDIEPTDKVERIKERVEEKEGIPPAQQRLIFSGKQMNDEKTAADYKVTGGSVLHLVLALRGGNKIQPKPKPKPKPQIISLACNSKATLKVKERPIRKKKDRCQLKGHSCPQCQKFFEKLGHKSEEKHSRHRSDVSPPKTPPHFWEVDFPSTPECKKRGYIR